MTNLTTISSCIEPFDTKKILDPAGTIISLQGELVTNYDVSTNYLSNPRDKTFKKLWKGKEGYLDFGPYRSKVMIRGNDTGIPVVYLKGGPGSMPLSSGQKRYWKPERMKVALSSWRACGDSTPLGGLDNNTTEDLVADIETMRVALNASYILLAGQCWGGTVAIKYAARYPERTLGIVTMLPYLARQVDIDQSFGPNGIAQKYPMEYSLFAGSKGRTDIREIFKHYAEALNRDFRSPEAVDAFANWLRWEIASSGDKGTIGPERLDTNSKQFLWEIAGERVNVNYVKNSYFLPPEGVTQELNKINNLAKEGKPILYVAHRNDPLSAPCYMDVLQQELPDASRIVFENTDWHWIAPRSNGSESSSYSIENAFAFMIERALNRLQKLGLGS